MVIPHRPPVHASNDNDPYEVLVERQTKVNKNYDTLKNCNSIPIGSTIWFKERMGDDMSMV